MELFKNANFDFLGKQKIFITISVMLLAAGFVSLAMKGGPRYGIDFKGGTMTYVRFVSDPDEDKIRTALASKIRGEVSVQPVIGSNEVMIGTEEQSEKDLDKARQVMLDTLKSAFGGTGTKPDFHGMGVEALADALTTPLAKANVSLSTEQIKNLAAALANYRDTPPRSGLIKSFDELSGVAGATPAVINVLKQEFALGTFLVRQFELVGPKIGGELRWQAIYATLLALAGMLVYIAFRFETIYGVAAVAAVFHDTLVTVGLFSIFNYEINLTVVAALLTLVGYSMNDTIVVFDRVRENLKTMRKESFPALVNSSINQTLSRTVLTSGLTFLTVVALLVFGGQVLFGFAFALTAGIIVGTYSSVFIASPILIFWQNMMEDRKKAAKAGAPPAKEAVKEAGSRKAPTKTAK